MFDAPPKTIFLLGLFAGIAIISIVALIFVLVSREGDGDFGFSSGKGSDQVTTAKDVNKNANGNTNSGTTAPTTTTTKDLKILESDHVFGDKNAPVVMIEYSDFQCPFCLRFHPTIKQILKEYPDKVAWVYRHFPLDSIHQHARRAAEASECAAEQGKFFEYADELFNNQSNLGEDLYTQLASKLGLDTGQFEDCLSSGKYKTKINADVSSGQAAGVRGTPATFINGQLVSGAQSFDTVKGIIDSELSKLKK